MYSEEYLFERDTDQAIGRCVEAINRELKHYNDDVIAAAKLAVGARFGPPHLPAGAQNMDDAIAAANRRLAGMANLIGPTYPSLQSGNVTPLGFLSGLFPGR